LNIDTKYHGSVEIKESQILTFEKGIPGFPLEKQFALLPLTDDDIFYVMQSISTPGLAFVLTSPFNFFEEYDFDLEELVISELVLKSQNDVLVYSILSVQDPFEKTTANLQAPVIINSKNRRAKQVILHDEQYNTKHPIIKKTGTKGDQ
jgi:flagellar assembly factor FliW